MPHATPASPHNRATVKRDVFRVTVEEEGADLEDILHACMDAVTALGYAESLVAQAWREVGYARAGAPWPSLAG